MHSNNENERIKMSELKLFVSTVSVQGQLNECSTTVPHLVLRSVDIPLQNCATLAKVLNFDLIMMLEARSDVSKGMKSLLIQFGLYSYDYSYETKQWVDLK